MTADPGPIPPAPAPSSDQADSALSAARGAAGKYLHRKTQASTRVWLLRIRALLFVTVCATFGVLLLILPWTPKWTDNSFLLTYPELRELASSGFTRGLSSGLGVLDLWLGFWEAIHYHESHI